MLEGWKRIYNERMHGGAYKKKAEVKARRKKLKRLKVQKQDGFVHKEGTMHSSVVENWGIHFLKNLMKYLNSQLYKLAFNAGFWVSMIHPVNWRHP